MAGGSRAPSQGLYPLATPPSLLSNLQTPSRSRVAVLARPAVLPWACLSPVCIWSSPRAHALRTYISTPTATVDSPHMQLLLGIRSSHGPQQHSICHAYPAVDHGRAAPSHAGVARSNRRACERDRIAGGGSRDLRTWGTRFGLGADSRHNRGHPAQGPARWTLTDHSTADAILAQTRRAEAASEGGPSKVSCRVRDAAKQSSRAIAGRRQTQNAARLTPRRLRAKGMAALV